MSRALTSPERVSEDTLARITEAVAQTGYTVNQAARSLRLRAARTLLIALPNIGNPFYSTILDAVIQRAAQRGYGVLVANRFGSDPTMGLKDYFYTNRADGLLLFDSALDLEALNQLPLARGNVPIVLSCDDLPSQPFNIVMTNNRTAAEEAVSYLIALGHRQIGYVRSKTTLGMVSERLAGFEMALRKAGLPIRGDWIWDGNHSLGGGLAAGRCFLEQKDRPSAVFCGNDETAMGFLSALRAGGVECPRDVSVVGFDDISVAEHFSPPLTTMRQPRQEMGEAATDLLLDLLENNTEPPEPKRIVLPSSLVIRSSTAPYPR